MSLVHRIAISNGNKARKAAATLALIAMNQTKVATWNNRLQAEIKRKQKVQSVLFIVNRPSGTGHTAAEIEYLRLGFNRHFAPIPRRVFTVTEAHADVTHHTRAFLTAYPGPWLLLSGGGSGTNRALVQGMLTEVDNRSIRPDDVQISALRMGSGNLIPKHFGLPSEPLVALQHVAKGLFAGQTAHCCIYRATFYYPNNHTRVEYGIAMAGIGQVGRVPDDVEHWRAKHPRLMQWSCRQIPLEIINTFQYITFSLLRAVKCLIYPKRAELVEVKYRGRSEQFRLFAGILVNFDFPQLPFQTGCTIDEPRLVLCLIPQTGRRQIISALLSWPHLNNHCRSYQIRPDHPVEILFLERERTILALDEDTFTAPNRISFDSVTLVNFVTGAPPPTKENNRELLR